MMVSLSTMEHPPPINFYTPGDGSNEESTKNGQKIVDFVCLVFVDLDVLIWIVRNKEVLIWLLIWSSSQILKFKIFI